MFDKCNHLETCGEITDYCSCICPFCKGDLCMHEYEDLIECKRQLTLLQNCKEAQQNGRNEI